MAEHPARRAATEALAAQIHPRRFMTPGQPDTSGLEARDARLAVAMHRAALRHWITLEHLIGARLRKGRCADLEPAMRAVLVVGAAQLFLFEKLPPHAVVHASVDLARQCVRPKAAGLVNAVLRGLAEIPVRHDVGAVYEPARDCFPVPGGVVRLGRDLLPETGSPVRHLSVATSHPPALVEAWLERHGPRVARDLLVHSQAAAPTIVHWAGAAPVGPEILPHEQAGFGLWQGEPAELGAFLARHAHCWVQDPTAAHPLDVYDGSACRCVIDVCAGMGTKTRQLLRACPQARLIATDADARRLSVLRGVFAEEPRVEVVEPEQLNAHAGRADAVLLDVPCSNTGVFARRLEARYRWSPDDIRELVGLQRRIVEQAAPLLRRDGAGVAGDVIYSTCSIEPEENERQAAWIARTLGLRVIRERCLLPAGEGCAYHDGGYHAVFRRD